MKKIFKNTILATSLITITGLVNADEYKMIFDNSEKAFPVSSQDSQGQQPQTASGYLNLIGESNITITASRTDGPSSSSGLGDGWYYNVNALFPETTSPIIGTGGWANGWYNGTTNEWIRIAFNDEPVTVSGFEFWVSLGPGPKDITVRVSTDNGGSWTDATSSTIPYAENGRIDLPQSYENVTNVELYIHNNYGDSRFINIGEIQFY